VSLLADRDLILGICKVKAKHLKSLETTQCKFLWNTWETTIDKQKVEEIRISEM
jgi:hypothetical protein